MHVGVVCMKRYNLKTTLIIGGMLSVIGSLLRLIIAIFRDSMSDSFAYSIILLGQSCAALSQPIYVNFPSLISNYWFPVHERDISTTIASLFNPLGNAIGQVIPTIFVSESNNCTNYTCTDGFMILFLIEFIVCVIPVVIAYFYFESVPPTPPSFSNSMKNTQVDQPVDLNYRLKSSEEEEDTEMNKIKIEFNNLMANKNYLILLFSFSVGIGMCYIYYFT